MKSLYKYIPHIFKVILVNIYGYFLERKRYSHRFYKILNEYKEKDKYESPQLNMSKLMELTKDSDYYKLKSEDDFYLLPVITKETIKNDYDRIINIKHVNSYLNTSGTTGSGLKYPVSREFIYHQWAMFWKFRMMHGVSLETWCAYLIGKTILNKDKNKPPYWIKSYSTKQLLLSLPHLNANSVESYLKEIKKNNIKWLHAYPSALNLLAGLIQDRNLYKMIRDLDLSLITTSSEILYNYQKRNIEEIFGCNVRQLYGLTEGVANIFECEFSNLHVDESFSFVEFLKDDNQLDHYKIIGTQYHNKAFPLIRYDTGDSVMLPSNEYKCPCGRRSRIVKEIIGREQDYLVLHDNTKRVRIGSIIFKELYNIKKAQIIQRKKGAAEFYIVKGPKYSDHDEKFLAKEIKRYLGSNFQFDIIYTESLIESANGKTRLIINALDPENVIVNT